jgi:hypothetical protein
MRKEWTKKRSQKNHSRVVISKCFQQLARQLILIRWTLYIYANIDRERERARYSKCFSVSALLQLLQLWRSSVAALLQLCCSSSLQRQKDLVPNFSFHSPTTFGSLSLPSTRPLSVSLSLSLSVSHFLSLSLPRSLPRSLPPRSLSLKDGGTHVCMNVCMLVCMYVCMYECMNY